MATKYEMSKTYQYRKVMKPLLERKRRARINKCLDDLKDLIAECMQEQSGDPNVKLEKADILELTVQHLRTIKARRQAAPSTHHNITAQQSFRAGYIQAANEVSRCLATLPNVDVALGTRLMTHLGLRLNQLEAAEEVPVAPNKPLSINTSSQRQQPAHAYSMCSPSSSGYASDYSDYSQSSPAPSSGGLLQVAASVWRPW